jgi:hypothetical protein
MRASHPTRQAVGSCCTFRRHWETRDAGPSGEPQTPLQSPFSVRADRP